MIRALQDINIPSGNSNTAFKGIKLKYGSLKSSISRKVFCILMLVFIDGAG